MGKVGMFALCSLFLLAACNDESKDVGPAGAEQEAIEQETVTEEKAFTAPFTGEKVTEQVTQRPVLVTINNHPDARPQTGLTEADVVYEMLAEGDVTRFLALYQSEIPASIGPVRSARSYFVDVAKGLDAFYVAHGYSPEAKELLARGDVDNINGMSYDGSLFKRSSDRVAPHNSYFDAQNLQSAAEKVDASLLYQKKVLYSFYEDVAQVQAGAAANHIAVQYSQNAAFNSSYAYDSATNTYARSSNHTVTIDNETKQPVQLSNVLFFEMEHKIVDNEGRRDINMTSGGNAYIAQQGMLREVQWKNDNGVLMAIEEDGSKVKLIPGQTWVHFIPTSPGLAGTVTYSE